MSSMSLGEQHGRLVWLCLALCSALACSHEDELELLRVRRSQTAEAGVPPPPPCEVTIMSPAPGSVVDLKSDLNPDLPGVQVDVGLQVGPYCAPGALSYGLCQRDLSNQIVAPASWQDTVQVSPNGQHQLRVTLLDEARPQLPCVEFHGIHAADVVRACSTDVGERLCSAVNTCYMDTATNPQRCGDACKRCPTGDHGTPTCAEGMCALRCEEGYHFEAGSCHARPGCKGLEKACDGKDCCAMDRIPEEGAPPIRFVRGYDRSDNETELPEFQPASSPPVTVDPFWLDRYEVTVARYRLFVEDYERWRGASNPRPGHGTHPRIPTGGWRSAWNVQGTIAGAPTSLEVLPASKADLIARLKRQDCGSFHSWTDQAGANENLAINCVDFYLAFAYCIWDGDSSTSRIPTEAEWMAAAHGGGKQRAYPWSDPPESLEIENRAKYGDVDRLPLAVGSYPLGAGLWGTLDLGGNVHEWVRDGATTSQHYSYVRAPSDPIDLTNDDDTGRPRALRGGSFKRIGCPECDARTRLRVAARQVLYPYQAYNDTGVRCARSY